LVCQKNEKPRLFAAFDDEIEAYYKTIQGDIMTNLALPATVKNKTGQFVIHKYDEHDAVAVD
jgi:hypothetical protein